MISKKNLTQSTTQSECSLNELVSSFNRAIVTHALHEEPRHPERLKMCKIVVLYNYQEVSFEDVKRGSENIMKYQFFNLVKTSLFDIVGNSVKKSIINFKARLFRSIYGFTPDTETVDDNIAMFEQYVESMKGGNYGTV